jgi:hypothetical protein
MESALKAVAGKPLATSNAALLGANTLILRKALILGKRRSLLMCCACG